MERYDPTNDQWVEMASLLTVRNGCGVGVLDGYIYVVGGYDGTTCLKTVERCVESGVYLYFLAIISFISLINSVDCIWYLLCVYMMKR